MNLRAPQTLEIFNFSVFFLLSYFKKYIVGKNTNYYPLKFFLSTVPFVYRLSSGRNWPKEK